MGNQVVWPWGEDQDSLKQTMNNALRAQQCGGAVRTKRPWQLG
jgi:hypothetical protein